VEIPAIISCAPDSWEQVDKAITALQTYDWVVFTSVNGVDYFMERLRRSGFDVRKFGSAKVAVIGPATAERLELGGIIADLKPAHFTSDALFDALACRGIPAGSRFLLLRADIADKALSHKLASAGAHVDDVCVYKTLPAPIDVSRLRSALCEGDPPGVTFTSSSTVRNFIEAAWEPLFTEVKSRLLGFSIGPKTSEAMRQFGIEPAIEATEHTIAGLVEAVVGFYSRNKGEHA
jgi:uroporphyrinogen III methyltransferase/synthase